MSLIFTIASRNLFQDRLRFVASLIGIVLSVVLVMVQMGLYSGFSRLVTTMIDHASTDLWILDSRAKCNRALREPDLHVFAKVFEDCLKRSLEAKAFSGREIGGDDDVLDFLVGHFVDVDLTRQPAS